MRDVAVAVWKKRGYGWEDKLFKVCDASSPDRPIRRFTRQCANATLGRRTCICSHLRIDATPKAVYGEGSAPRQAWHFVEKGSGSCADVTKYKANWNREQLVLSP